MNSLNKTILITGASGFLGNILYTDIKAKVKSIVTLSRKNAEIPCDLSKEIPKLDHRFDIIIHSAGKAHLVPKTEAEKKSFYDINYEGTLNLLKGIENSGFFPEQIIFISSVSVYGLDQGENIIEETPQQAIDPYGKSKIMAEESLIQWCLKNNITYYIFRLPLIAGINPPGNLGSMIKAIRKNRYFSIGKNNARKSMVWAEDLSDFFLNLPLNKSGIYNLNDGKHPSFSELENVFSRIYNKKIKRIPYKIIKLAAMIGDISPIKVPINTLRVKKITSTLTFSDKKARIELNWNPVSVIEHYQKTIRT